MTTNDINLKLKTLNTISHKLKTNKAIDSKEKQFIVEMLILLLKEKQEG